MNKDWLQELKAGDEAIVDSRNSSSVQVVGHVTRTMIVLQDGTRFQRRAGQQIGGDTYYWATLRQCTPEAKAKVLAERRQARLAQKMREVIWNKVSLDKLERIVAILNEGEQP